MCVAYTCNSRILFLRFHCHTQIHPVFNNLLLSESFKTLSNNGYVNRKFAKKFGPFNVACNSDTPRQYVGSGGDGSSSLGGNKGDRIS